ncbi:unnamed protein product [Closterium sp. NIES-53]
MKPKPWVFFKQKTVSKEVFPPDYATSLVAESVSASACPPSVGGECALGMDVLEDRQEEFECFATGVPHLVSMLLAPEGEPDAPDIPTPRSYAEAIEGPFSSHRQAAMDAEMASWKSTRTYVDEVPPPGANIVSGMWIFRVKRPPGSPPVFKARYVACGFSQRQGVDFFHTFSPTPKMTTLRVLLHVAAQRDYELHSLDFSTAFLQGSLHEEIWLRRPPRFTGSFPAGTQWSLRRPVYGLRQVPHDSVFATADTEALAHVKSELQKRYTCTDLEVLYVDNKAMLALCQQHRLEHRTKHISLRYFLARELQQRDQLRLAYVASQANTANLALPFLSGLVSLCSPPLCLWSSFIPSVDSDKGVKEKFCELNCVPAIIPSGCTTKELEPPEVVVRSISRAWEAVPVDLIKRAFFTCGISNALDGSEDSLADRGGGRF